MVYKLEREMELAAQWGLKTFDTTTRNLIYKMFEELHELELAPNDQFEMADLLIILAHIAKREGVDLAKAVHDKMNINRLRTWEGLSHIKNGSIDLE